MATRVITTVGGLNFAGFYYPEIYRSLLQYLRINKDRLGLTDENDYEVHTQLLSSFAAVGHMNNTRLDSIATEMFIDSAQLRSSIKELLRLQGIELKTATPAVAEILAKLSTSTSVNQLDYVPSLSLFETEGTPPVAYENLETFDLDRTDRLTSLFYTTRASASGGSDKASVDTNSDVVTRASGTWSTSIVGQEIYLKGSLAPNLGFFRVVSRLDATRIRVVQVPSARSPQFQTETDIVWSTFTYSTDQAAVTYGVGDVTPFGATNYDGECLYGCHKHVMPNRIDFTITSASTSGLYGVWEYYDAERSILEPDNIYYDATNLYFDITSLMSTRIGSGAIVTISLKKTGASEKRVSSYNVAGLGTVNYVKAEGLFGQTTPSEDPSDYYVTAEWVPFSNLDDTCNLSGTDLAQTGRITFDIPQTIDRSWSKGEVNLIEGYWWRFRYTGFLGATRPTIDTIQIDQDDLYIIFPVTQGETVGPTIFGSSDGSANQFFTLTEGPYLQDTETIEVDESGTGVWLEYTIVDSFKFSGPLDRHYTRKINNEDQMVIYFGDGTNGKIPPVGAGNIRGTIRVGGEENGNVGVDQILSNATGIGGIVNITNPRPARGWRLKDGGDEIDLERLRHQGPTQLRVRSVGTRSDDMEYIAVEEYTNSSGIKLIERAVAVEEGYGPKTVKLLVVGLGGVALSNTELLDLETFFNGDRYARPPIKGKLLVNHRLTAVNYEPATITIEATVVWPRGSIAEIRTALSNYLNPLAVEGDQTTYIWNFGGQVSYSKIHNLIHEISHNIRDVPILKLAKGTATPAAASVTLSENELPVTIPSKILITLLEA